MGVLDKVDDVPELLSIKTEQYGDLIFGNIFEDTLVSDGSTTIYFEPK